MNLRIFYMDLCNYCNQFTYQWQAGSS